MTGASRIISFVIGLIVLILLFVLIANRFSNSRRTQANANTTPTVTVAVTTAPNGERGAFDFFGLFRKKPTATPTPTMSFAEQLSGEMTTDQFGNPVPKAELTRAVAQGQVAGTTNVQSVPNTGFPVLAWPVLAAAFGGGMWLRKKK